jgi:hypothetical protein
MSPPMLPDYSALAIGVVRESHVTWYTMPASAPVERMVPSVLMQQLTSSHSDNGNHVGRHENASP